MVKCQRIKEPEGVAYSKIFNDFQKIFDDLGSNKRTISIKVNKSINKLVLDTFKYFQELIDDLVRMEGMGNCGGGEVKKSFDEKVKNFTKFIFAWELLP